MVMFASSPPWRTMRVERALDEAIDDEVVEAARDDREPRPLGDDEVAFEDARRLTRPCALSCIARRLHRPSGTLSTTSRPKPERPAILRGLFVSRRILCSPRSARTCAPRPNSRSGLSPAARRPAPRAAARRAPRAASSSRAEVGRRGGQVDDDAAPLGLDATDGLAEVAAAVARRRREDVADDRARVHAAEHRLVRRRACPCVSATNCRESVDDLVRRRRSTSVPVVVERDRAARRRGARGARSGGGTG